MTIARLRFLRPKPPTPDGLSVIRVVLVLWLPMIRDVGRGPALLFLTLRAFRERRGSTLASPALDDLRWTLRASRRQLRRWMRILAAHGFVVYHERPTGDRSLTVEFPAAWRLATLPSEIPSTPNELPTHWWLDLLPRIGRTPFVLYLALLAYEPTVGRRADLSWPDLARTVNLGIWDLWLVRNTLRWYRLLRYDRQTVLWIVTDPPPISRLSRLLLRWRAQDWWPRNRGLLLLVTLIFCAAAAAGTYFLLRLWISPR